MPKISNKSTTKVDKTVGRNVRVHRLLKGLTQTDLAEKLGVRFQQVQKYEKGTNRIGSGRLYQIAVLLEVPVTTFFEGSEKRLSVRNPSPYDLLADPACLRLIQAFSEISDRKIQRAMLALVETMNSGGKD